MPRFEQTEHTVARVKTVSVVDAATMEEAIELFNKGHGEVIEHLTGEVIEAKPPIIKEMQQPMHRLDADDPDYDNNGNLKPGVDHE